MAEDDKNSSLLHRPSNISYLSADDIALIDKYNLVTEIVTVYGFPAVFIPGLVGNVLCIITLQKKQFSNNNVSLLLTLLAVVDLFGLCCRGIPIWLEAMDISYVFVSSTVMCKIWGYLVFLFIQLAAWILVLITTERLIIVQWPLKHNSYVTRRVLLISVLMISLVLLAFSVNVPIYNTSQTVLGYNYSVAFCSEELPHQWLILYSSWSQMLLECLLPFFILLVGNTILIIKLKSRDRQRKYLTKNSESMGRHVTMMLMTASFAFLVVNTPLNTCIILLKYMLPEWRDDPISTAKWGFIYSTTNLIGYSNHAINFYLYFISGSKFRQEAKELLCSWSCRYITTESLRDRAMAPSATQHQHHDTENTLPNLHHDSAKNSPVISNEKNIQVSEVTSDHTAIKEVFVIPIQKNTKSSADTQI